MNRINITAIIVAVAALIVAARAQTQGQSAGLVGRYQLLLAKDTRLGQ